MHFSIPETKEVKETNGSSYVVYNIYINGIFHCSMRYSQMHTLNEQLKQVFGGQALPYFPPKKLFPLSKTQLEERQFCLEKYLQGVSQQNDLVNSSVLRRFLFSAQQKLASTWHDDNNLTVWLLNGTQVVVKVTYEDSSEVVLQKVCDQLRIPHELNQYFSLFVQRQGENGETSLIHLLQNYECPVITMKQISGQTKIVIRKSYWDPSIDIKLLSDRSTLNLLYSQTVFDVERGWIVTDRDTQEKLATLQSRGAKRDYLEVSRTLKFYGYVRFEHCTCDYPEPNTETTISIGQKDLIFTPKSESLADKEFKFRITRIRCWKITPLNDIKQEVQLSFEYLINTDKLQWITIVSEYVFFLSVCLQSIVDELMLKKSGTFANNGNSENDNLTTKIPSSSQTTSVHYQKPSMARRSKINKDISLLTKKIDGKNSSFVPLLENDSFVNIGDDDL